MQIFSKIYTSIFSVGALSIMSGSIFAFLNSDSTSPSEKPMAQKIIPENLKLLYEYSKLY